MTDSEDDSYVPRGQGADAPAADDVGRREANKRATRAAIRSAADELIARQGFEATTVRQIADAAGVTERTFYRYFDGKEGVVASELVGWMDKVYEAIVSRPPSEDAVEAVKQGLLEVSRHVQDRSRAHVVWAFVDAPETLKLMRRSGTRPLLRLEALIVAAILDRGDDHPQPGGVEAPDRFAAELVARTAVAIMRTVAGERRRSTREGAAIESVAVLIERGFEVVGSLFGADANDF